MAQRTIPIVSVILCTLAVMAFAADASSPRPARRSQADQNDPLLRELERLRDEVQQLRQEVRGMAGMQSRGDVPAAGRVRSTAPGHVPAEPPTALTRPKLPPPYKPSQHWSFQPLQRPALPAVQQAAWVRDDLDRFILARLEGAGLAPARDADRYALLRRISFDLTGLPPTEQEILAFVNDTASDDAALARVVDNYLASPAFGQRWARHWLDVVRYADSVGRTWNAPFTYAWRYRDYVVDAFNEDKPYDRFILEQLAGDLLTAGSIDERRANLTATGFLALGSLALNDGRQEGFVMDRVDDQIDVSTRAFLGLTVACARCHDHKYDPVTMRDYYALAGVFYSTQTLSGQGHVGDLGPGGYVDAANLIRLPRGQSPSPGSVARGVHSMADFQEEWRRVRDDARYTTDDDLAMGVLEAEVRDCPLRIKGDAYDAGEVVPRGEVRIEGLPGFPRVPNESSGRLQLAQWIASADNPLTARVMVNRIWQHLFGRGLVATPDNFGINAAPPSHPELLDHLALRFIEDGWSMKRLIRNIVLSRTYRLSTGGQASAKHEDPANELYARHNLRRLEVEALRDSLLRIAGRLEMDAPYGIQVAGVGGKGKSGVVRSLLRIDSPYRTIYLPVLRSLTPAVYGTFDFPDPCQVSGRRETTTVAPQALFFMNNDLVMRCARDAASALIEDAASDADRISKAYLRILSRPPSDEELADALAFLREVSSKSSGRDEEHDRWTRLLHALLASGEFRYAL